MIKFTETQAFSSLAYAILALTSVFSLGSFAAAPRIPHWLWLFSGGSLGVIFNLLCLRTTVTDRELTISFGALFPLYRRRIRLDTITSARAETYNPLGEYGGWGIKMGSTGVALNARGNRGVRLTLQDGRRVLVGSQRPEELAEALGAAG